MSSETIFWGIICLETLVLKSPAKINLFLEVLRKREDGYHEIRSLMQTVDICDELLLRRRKKGVVIRTNDPECPADETNLAFKAAQLILEEAKIKDGVSIHIKKIIPIAAGLGGGSSNAATTLRGMNQLFELKLNDEKLRYLASQIGSDVPFFLSSGQALVSGRGEIIEPITIYRNYWLVLACPEVKVSTRWAYQNLKINLTNIKNEVNLKFLGNPNAFFEALPHFRNDLEEVVGGKYAIIHQLKEILENLGAVKSSMSGSGPTVYGVFERKPKAEEVARKLSLGNWSPASGGDVFVTQPIPHSV